MTNTSSQSNQINSDNDASRPTHYIGIGASAGGLEALQLLLKNLPVDSGACFVIVQHLSPDFKSMMLELLSKHTSMTIENVVHGVRAKPNTIYLLPRKKNMIVTGGELQLTDKKVDSGLNLPIDAFFRSLAVDQEERAIGIVLSGTGSDGSRGVKALKESGALIIAQEPDSAKFEGMPNSAINTGIVDLIIRPEEMGEKLATYISHHLVSGPADVVSKDMESSHDVMNEIYDVLKNQCDIDFSKYKPSTIARRIERRMTIKQVTSLRDYLSILMKEEYEVNILCKELLIGVTRFFRDTEAFDELRSSVLPEIVRSSGKDNIIRVWVAACSSGEEAYSISILLHEEAEKQSVRRSIKVFATDVNPDAVAEAGSGVFGEDISHDVGAPLLAKYFTKHHTGGYKISEDIRHSVVFAAHNMIKDAPFSNIDLVTCRNVLIYFKPNAQQRVLSSFHFALKKNRYLFLGSSENLGEVGAHFQTLNERQKIYKKMTDIRLPLPNLGRGRSNAATITDAPKSSEGIPSVSTLMKNYRSNNTANSPVGFANEKLISEYVPPCILVDADQNALHVYGDINPFVKRLPPGRISTKISDMINDDMNIAVSSAMQRARTKNEEVYYTEIQTKVNDEIISVNVRVLFIKEHDIEESRGFYWLIFEQNEACADRDVEKIKFSVGEQAKQRIEDLEQELKFNKEHLQITVEELETTNEELQSANEELMSSNEELQSTNEELQSVNEELYTVNSEYQEKITEISQANGDLDAVMGLSKIGIIFLDEDLLVRRYTDAAKEYINLLESDVNRPLHHISMNIPYDNMIGDVSKVINTGKPFEKELTLDDKSLLRVAIHSYGYDGITQRKGVAITFSDISRVKYIERGMSVAYKKLRTSINNALEMLDVEPFTKKLSVLVIDDSEIYLEFLENQLKQIEMFDVEVFKASDTKTALVETSANNIDICITDYYLKNESAIDLLDSIKKAKLDIPVIVITASMDKELSPTLLSHGALDLIDKETISPALLARSIKFAVRRHQIDNEIAGFIGEVDGRLEESDAEHSDKATS